MRQLPTAPTALLLAAAAAWLAGCATGGETTRFVPDFAEPVEVGPDSVIEPPATLRRTQPRYPDVLRSAGREGRVELSGVIRPDGRLTDLEVVHSDHPLFTEALFAVVPEWRFRPATVDGEPAAVYYKVTQLFLLE